MPSIIPTAKDWVTWKTKRKMIFSITNKSFGKIKTVITKRDFKHDHLSSDGKQFNEFICISLLFFNQLGS